MEYGIDGLRTAGVTPRTLPHVQRMRCSRRRLSTVARWQFLLGLWAAPLFLGGCGQKPPVAPSQNDNPGLPISQNGALPMATSVVTNPALAMYSYEVVHTFPHDPKAFTQGLVFLDGELLESTGMNGQSSLRRVELGSGRVLQQVSLPYEYFAEGIALLGRKIFQLTWQNGKCFVYDLTTFRRKTDFAYTGEGWGLATDGQWLIMSDGTDRLRFVDPDTFEIKRTVNVTAAGQPLNHLNELEFIKGEIFANIWQTDFVARIDPASGKVLGVINFTGLLAPADRDIYADVLNGIAYDGAGDRLFVTGKRWPKLFEVRLKPK
jgi:glutamine cyclotransferase